ncbi:site-2 protease family protein [Fangia hongkongensis]|uniref:site-2 protease family protein n=1 Tax=Fangia hongkongensis TaxID=270495 RepID=UPI000368B1CA|nr:site-2 protease family protein [Fangia hongkongensis]MBK2124807.1 efflux RND transporter periplasmic adaptor subunit [Fangia hongkongensis]
MKNTLPDVLPSLRKSICIYEGGIDYKGAPTWVIEDTLNNQYFHIDWKSYQIIKHWQRSSQALIAQIKSRCHIEISEQRIIDMLQFLLRNALVHQSYEQISALYHLKEKQTSQSIWLKLAKNYLFFRIPVLHPEKMLNQLYAYIGWLLSKRFFYFMMFLLILAIIQLQSLWESFTHSLFELFSFEYIIIFLLALLLAKSIHELGHALASKKYGLKVPTIGVAFLVLFPMLYTDTQQSWKVKDSKNRLKISIAGIWMELYVAIIALWLWMLLPDGAFKSACFFLATYSLLTSILINISPFLRFDGYYVLSDLMAMRNLQTRSFALTRWRLREILFGFGFLPPELFSKGKARLLILYAFMTWLYRFILFLAIAFIVYHLFFKALGIVLFLLEIYFFILKPIVNEISKWLQMKESIKWNKNTRMFLWIIILLIVLCFIPFSSSIHLPATLSYYNKVIFTPENAQIKRVFVENNERVTKGEPLLSLSMPDLDYQKEKLIAQKNALVIKLRNIGVYQSQNTNKAIIQSELDQITHALQTIEKKQATLNIKSPVSGVITGFQSGIKNGLWLKKNQAMFSVYKPNEIKITAYINESELRYLKEGTEGYFIPNNFALGRIKVQLRHIATYPVSHINEKWTGYNYYGSAPLSLQSYHASIYGGSIPTTESKEGIEAVSNMYQVSFVILDRETHHHFPTQKGRIFLYTQRSSLAVRLYQYLYVFWHKVVVF